MIVRFTIGAVGQTLLSGSGRQGSRTLISGLENRLSRAARPTVSGYLPKEKPENRNQKIEKEPSQEYRKGDSLSSFLVSILLFLFFFQWTAGELNPDSLGANQVSSLWTSSPSLPDIKDEGLSTKDQPVIPDGLEPSLPGCGPGVFAAGPRDPLQ